MQRRLLSPDIGTKGKSLNPIWHFHLVTTLLCSGNLSLPAAICAITGISFISWMLPTYACWFRAVPEIILRGGTFSFRPLHPWDTHGVRAPWPSGHSRTTMDQVRLDPRDKLTLHPSDRLSTKHPPPPQDTKSACGPTPPEDNFWNSPYHPCEDRIHYNNDNVILVFVSSSLQTRPATVFPYILLSNLYAIGLNFKAEGIWRFPAALYDGIMMFFIFGQIMQPFIWGEIKPFWLQRFAVQKI